MLVLSCNASAAFTNGNGSVAFTNGNELHKWMTEWGKENGSRHSTGLFRGYVSGVVDTGNSILFCTGRGVTRGQYTDIVAKFLSNNPELWNNSASSIVIKALETAFPCNDYIQ